MYSVYNRWILDTGSSDQYVFFLGFHKLQKASGTCEPRDERLDGPWYSSNTVLMATSQRILGVGSLSSLLRHFQ